MNDIDEGSSISSGLPHLHQHGSVSGLATRLMQSITPDESLHLLKVSGISIDMQRVCP